MRRSISSLLLVSLVSCSTILISIPPVCAGFDVIFQGKVTGKLPATGGCDYSIRIERIIEGSRSGIRVGAQAWVDAVDSRTFYAPIDVGEPVEVYGDCYNPHPDTPGVHVWRQPYYVKKLSTALPDLTFQIVGFDRTEPLYDGDVACFTATICNQGQGDANNFVVETWLDGSVYESQTMSLQSGRTANMRCSRSWTATQGTHTLAWIADTTNVVVESNEFNNRMSRTFTVLKKEPPPPPPGPARLNFYLLGPYDEYIGEDAFVWVQCNNAGKQEGDFTVTARCGDAKWRVSPQAVSIHLAPGAITYIGFQVFLDNSGTGDIVISDGNETKKHSIYVQDEWKKTVGIILNGVLNEVLVATLHISSDPSAEVRRFTEQVLSLKGVGPQSGNAEKARVLFDYVVDHMGYERTVLYMKIGTIVDVLNQHGGVQTTHKIMGDCKQYTVFLAGLLRATDISVRILMGMVEAYPAFGSHAWLEAKIGGEWIVFNPTKDDTNRDTGTGWYGDNRIKMKDFPINLKEFALKEGAKKTFEFLDQWGGFISVVSYDPDDGAKTRTSEYKIGSKATSGSRATVVCAHSPVVLKVYDENDALMAQGTPFNIVFPVGAPITERVPKEAQLQGQIVVIEGYRSTLKIEVTGMEKGRYSLTTAYVDQSNILSKTISADISKDEVALFRVDIHRDGITVQQNVQPLTYYAYSAPFLIVAVVSLSYLFLLRRRREALRIHEAAKSTPRIIAVTSGPRVVEASSRPRVLEVRDKKDQPSVGG